MLRIMLYYRGGCKVINLSVQMRQQESVLVRIAEKEIHLSFYALENEWRMILPEGFHWADSVPNAAERKLLDRMSILLENGEDKLGVYCAMIPDNLITLRKYMLHLDDGVLNASIGRARDCRIFSDDTRMTQHHAIIQMKNGEVVYTDVGKNGSFINGRLLKGQASSLAPGDEILFPSGLQIIYLGGAVIAIGGVPEENIGLEEAGDDALAYLSDDRENKPYNVLSRPPRFLPKIEQRQYKLEAPPAQQANGKQPLIFTLGPSLTMSVPMLMGSFLSGTSAYARSGVIMIVSSSVLAVTWSLTNYLYSKHRERKQYEDAMHDYIQRLNRVEQEIAGGVNEIQTSMERYYPTVDAICSSCDALDASVWERTPASEMFLAIRLGSGQVRLPYSIEVPQLKMGEKPEGYKMAPYELKKKYDKLYNGPVVVNLMMDSPLGIVTDDTGKTLSALLIQLAALHSANDLKIAIIGKDGHEEIWRYLHALPHTLSGTNSHMIACSYADCGELLSNLNETLTCRITDETTEKNEGPYYVVVFEDAAYTRSHVLYSNILSSNVGFSACVCGTNELELPKECKKVFDARERKLYDYANHSVLEIEPEQISPEKTREAMRRLCTIKEQRQAGAENIPESVTFLETYGADTTAQLEIMHRWTVNSTSNDVKAYLGKLTPKSVFALDISDKAHGPHGIIAGTTGSGKSVLLQTLLLSLAVNYSPEQIQFIMIDYKGGGSFNAFKDLPHSIGFIDNLQGRRSIDRALYSIRGEVRRREALFKRYGVEDINKYIKQVNPLPGAKKLGHILVVIDEFSELMDEMPDFMPELISTARVGRSVGLHLLLATQKPSNKVGPEIWSNSRYHICLRVQTREDSIDMLHKPDAAYIKGMGRGFVQVGNDEIFEQIQTSYSGAAYKPDEANAAILPQLLDRLGKPTVFRSDKKNTGQTQMNAVIQEIMSTCLTHGIEAPGQMWMPELPAVLDLDAINSISPNFPDSLPICIGTMDDVENQRYLPAIIDIAAARLIAVVGHAGAGKTTFVQSVAYAISRTYTPQQVQLLIMSFGGTALLNLSCLPNVTDVLSSWDIREQKAVFRLLDDLIIARDAEFAKQQTDSFASYNRALVEEGKPCMPALIVVADRFAQWFDLFSDSEKEKLETMLSSAAGHGVYFLFTANSSKEIPSRMLSTFSVIPLGMESKADYAELLGVSSNKIIASPANVVGRGMISCNGLFEFQTGLAFGEPTDKVRRAKLEQYGNQLPPNDMPVLRVTRVPAEFGVQHLRPFKKEPGMLLPIGFEQSSLHPIYVDLYEKNIVLIGGKRQTGRSSVLRALAMLYAGNEGEIFAVAPARERADWQKVSDKLLFMPIGTPAKDQEDISSDVDDVFSAHLRLQRSAENYNDPANFRTIAETIPPLVIVLDDADSWLEESALYFQLWERLGQAIKLGAKYNIVILAAFAVGSYHLPDNIQAFSDRGHIIATGSTLSAYDPWNCAMPSNRQNEFMRAGEGFFVPDSRFPVKVYLPKE